MLFSTSVAKSSISSARQTRPEGTGILMVSLGVLGPKNPTTEDDAELAAMVQYALLNTSSIFPDSLAQSLAFLWMMHSESIQR